MSVPDVPDDAATPQVPAHDERGTPGHDLARAAARRAQAVRMRLAGFTYEQIAEETGYADKSAARHAVLRALDQYEHTQVTELKAVENAALNRAQVAIWPKVLEGDIKAVLAFIRISQRRARMNGLDAPQQVAITSPTRMELADAISEFRQTVMGETIEVHDDRDEA